MPELPEVETMVRGLRQAFRGVRLRAIEVHDARLLDGCTAERLAEAGRDAGVEAVERRGKWVVMTLAGAAGIIVIQPRMTGGFRLSGEAAPHYGRLAFIPKGSRQAVWFCDKRRFGKIAWYPDLAVADATFARSHGPDALQITLGDLTDRFKRTARGIKPTLLDQKVVAGIGNIYADEILFRAEVHPERRACALKSDEVSRIHESIAAILTRAIELEGSSFDGDYRTILGREGGYLTQSLVHLRRDEPCRRCETPVVKAKIAGLIGRPTYYCPTCQPPGGRSRGSSGRGPRDRVR